MAIQSSGLITLQDIEDEFGGTGSISLSEYYRNGVYVTSNNTSVPTSGAISLSNFYGATNQFSFNITSNTQNANLNTLALSAGWDGSAPLIATVNSGVYLWSDDTSVAGLIINVACTVINYGNIIGKGGNGGSYRCASGSSGGKAINVTASGTTIINNSGAFIAGGGGGGAQRGNSSGTGGGGAGSGTTAGRAGGGGGGYNNGSVYNGHAGGWGLPGTGSQVHYSQTIGGSAGNVGQSASVSNQSGAGGGWGARGGNSNCASGGAGGAAITGTSVSLTNNGTIYGIT